MKRIGTTLSMLVLAGSLAGRAFAANNVTVKDQGLDGYCHQRFPAIEPSSLGTDQPILESAATGEIIDFYGPCAESPTGADQVKAQELDQEFRLGHD